MRGTAGADGAHGDVRPDDIVVATYNVEALFDCKKEPGKLDHDYLPQGFYAWTEERLARKLENLGRVLRSVNEGRGPDILALQEVETREVVERLVDGLDSRVAEVVRLYHLEGKSYREISEATGISENTIGPVLSRARIKMRHAGTNLPTG